MEKTVQIINLSVISQQTVQNACSTIGILHAIGNAITQGVSVKEGSYLDGFLKRTKEGSMSPDEIAAALENDSHLSSMHEEATRHGQSSRPDAEEEVTTHFVCFSEVDGDLYELDGRKSFPINHGPIQSNLLKEATRVIRCGFMDKDPEELRFTILALAKSLQM